MKVDPQSLPFELCSFVLKLKVCNDLLYLVMVG